MKNDLCAAHAALDTIQSTANRYPSDLEWKTAIKMIRKAVADFEIAHDTTGYVGEKLEKILPTAEKLYSARQHRGNLMRVRVQLLTFLSNVRNALELPAKTD